ncbi:hypothetical protein ACFLRH_00385 [Actinomycetota bacterium]
MPRRNRVDPWGDLNAVPERGMFTGNRGCLVDDAGRLVRHHNGPLWITCVTEFRDWQHQLDQPHTWTPLFFLDDAAALAAGHRPCGLCRRADYLAYQAAVTAAIGADSPVLAPELNRRLADERLSRGRGLVRAHDRILWSSRLDELPAGAVVIHPADGAPHLVTARRLQPFGFDGWGPPLERPRGLRVHVLTPPTSIAALEYGFMPRLHPSAPATPPGTGVQMSLDP